MIEAESFITPERSKDYGGGQLPPIDADCYPMTDEVIESRILFSGGIIDTHLTGRPSPQASDIASLMSLVFEGRVEPHILENEFARTKALLRKSLGERSQPFIELLEEFFITIPATQPSSAADLSFAERQGCYSAEVALQMYYAEQYNLDILLVEMPGERNPSSDIRILTPRDFLDFYYSGGIERLELNSKEDKLGLKYKGDTPVLTTSSNTNKDFYVIDTDLKIEHFRVLVGSDIEACAEVRLRDAKHSQPICERAEGVGPVDALWKALGEAYRKARGTSSNPLPKVVLDYLFIEPRLLHAVDSVVHTETKMTFWGTERPCVTRVSDAEFTHADVVKSVFYAMLESINKDPKSSQESDVLHTTYARIEATDLLSSESKIFRNSLISSESFEEQNLAGLCFIDTVFRECDFRRAPISLEDCPTQMHGCEIFNTDFTRAELSCWDANGVKVSNGDFSGAELYRAQLAEAIIQASYFTGAVMKMVNLCKTQIEHTKMREAKLHDAVLVEAVLSEVDLEAANLDYANLQQALFTNVSLKRATLTDTQFQGAILWIADFSDAKLAGADFTRARILKANFAGATFINTKLPKQLESQLDLSDSQRKGIIWVDESEAGCSNDALIPALH